MILVSIGLWLSTVTDLLWNRFTVLILILIVNTPLIITLSTPALCMNQYGCKWCNIDKPTGCLPDALGGFIIRYTLGTGFGHMTQMWEIIWLYPNSLLTFVDPPVDFCHHEKESTSRAVHVQLIFPVTELQNWPHNRDVWNSHGPYWS